MFTIVFDGNLKDYNGNPFHTETPFGKPQVVSDGDATDRADDLEEALQRIVQWSEAYPIDIFPEPDLKKARELLASGGITLDAISAHCMRHIVEGVGKIARDALNADEDDGITLALSKPPLPTSE